MTPKQRWLAAVRMQEVDRLPFWPKLDAAYAPGTGYPEGVGLSTRELMELMRIVMQKLPVKAMDLVEVSPPLDHSDITSFAALKVIYEVWWEIQERLHRPLGRTDERQ